MPSSRSPGRLGIALLLLAPLSSYAAGGCAQQKLSSSTNATSAAGGNGGSGNQGGVGGSAGAGASAGDGGGGSTAGSGGATAGSGGTPAGAGGVAGSAGSGGLGGSIGPGGSGGAAGSGGGGSGGALSAALTLVAGGPVDVTLASWDTASWTTTALVEATADAPTIAMPGTQQSVALVRSTSGGQLRYAFWDGVSWDAFLAVGPGITTRARPSATGLGPDVHVAFQGDDFKHYETTFTGLWSGASAIPNAAGQDFGPNPGAIVAVGAQTFFGFPGNSQELVLRTWDLGVWGPATLLAAGQGPTNTPAGAALEGGGADAIAAYVRPSDAQVMFTTRTAGVWAAPAPIAMALSNDPPAVATMPGGGAVVAFRGQNSGLYAATFDGVSWTLPTSVGNPLILTTASPSLARGVFGAQAELAWVEADGAHHARLVGGVWTASVLVGGAGAVGVAIASAE